VAFRNARFHFSHYLCEKILRAVLLSSLAHVCFSFGARTHTHHDSGNASVAAGSFFSLFDGNELACMSKLLHYAHLLLLAQRRGETPNENLPSGVEGKKLQLGTSNKHQLLK
jgi:hypothetical protein